MYNIWNLHQVGHFCLEAIMSFRHVIKKEEHINTLEKFNIYIKTKNYNQINDKNTT